MSIYTVIVMRPEGYKDISCDFATPQWRQYAATGVVAETAVKAGQLAIAECQKADRRDLKDLIHTLLKGYTVLGHITEGGQYHPWLNGNYP